MPAFRWWRARPVKRGDALISREAGAPAAELLVPAEMAASAQALLRDYQQQVEAGAFALEDEDEEE